MGSTKRQLLWGAVIVLLFTLYLYEEKAVRIISVASFFVFVIVVLAVDKWLVGRKNKLPIQTHLVKPNVNKSINTMVEVCLRDDLLFAFIDEDSLFKRGVRELKEEGADGAQELAVLIKELLNCRSHKIRIALRAASELKPFPDLIKAVKEVLEAEATVPQPAALRYTPEIIGNNRIGWTDGTLYSIREQVKNTLRALEEKSHNDNGPDQNLLANDNEWTGGQHRAALESRNDIMPKAQKGFLATWLAYTLGYFVAAVIGGIVGALMNNATIAGVVIIILFAVIPAAMKTAGIVRK